MALASVLRSESADFNNDFIPQFGCGFNDTDIGFGAKPADSLSFALKAAESEDDASERKIEFLHGTTTLAFKVSVNVAV